MKLPKIPKGSKIDIELNAHEIEVIQQKIAAHIKARGIDYIEATLKESLAYIAMIRTMESAIDRALNHRPKGWESV
jgi:hypothetical protein